ncbi:hypothetical protein FKW77_009343 [Venturia effusa]|uniref:C2H2-type domain-containing protein n=1 Tax=Venturia effusa TaxID=50376 RepID=A0A517KX87_9PEZI|nr:hypothetical protein FKW77_009343 [Venturia effusa]
MAMAVDNRQQSQINGLAYNGIRYSQPQFTNPWVNNTSTAPSTQQFATSVGTSAGIDASMQRPTTMSVPSFGLPVTASALGPGSSLPGGLYEPQNSIDMPQGYGAQQYSAAGPSNPYAPTSSAGYTMEYATSKGSFPTQQTFDKRPSHPSVNSAALFDPQLGPSRRNSIIDINRFNQTTSQAQRTSISDAIDASRGMLHLSNSVNDMTPRNIYEAQGGSRTSSADSYGFPSTHSNASSISSASTYPSSYGSYSHSHHGSQAGSASDAGTDYSSASESVDLNTRRLPAPANLLGPGMPPAPQSMMGQFSSKVSSSSQKKHKCKICDKRFTRPSSLQTHMYSHTGEKPYACEVEGCGRHFSVVSNLRRHRKVHKGEGRDHPSPDEE